MDSQISESGSEFKRTDGVTEARGNFLIERGSRVNGTALPPRHRRRRPTLHNQEVNGSYIPGYSSTRVLCRFALVCSTGHHPDPDHRNSDIWQGIVCCRSAGYEKYLIPGHVCDEITYTPCIDAKQRPEALGSDVVGVGKATSGSSTDKLTREHRLTLDEAHLILNTKKEAPLEQILAVSADFSPRTFLDLLMSGGPVSQSYEHLFKQNSPSETKVPAKPVAGKRAQVKYHSHYLQSKVVRARERIEAEHKLQSTSSELGPPPTQESTPLNQ